MEQSQHADWVVAVIAGFLSFISPCVLPLIPGYISMISGLSVEQLQQRRRAHLLRILLSSVLFSAGLSLAFILVGLGVGAAGQWLHSQRTIINIVFGLVVIFFGLFVLGLVKLPALYRDRRLRLNPTSIGLWGAPLLGFAFAFGWTPCIGPWAASLLAVAAGQPPAQSALLFTIFGATFGVCFVAAGLLFASALRAFSFLQQNYRVIEIISGTILLLIGILLLTQQWDRAAAWLTGLVG
ncbi:MAG: cytochrome c biogenesis protein CcdA [Armatimonadota bacterium]|nr:MAG: cytochrome c biogenesis protein CcdA [Armatimonadota bacterium]